MLEDKLQELSGEELQKLIKQLEKELELLKLKNLKKEIELEKPND